jgi:regulator of protease activity HflC (stomatin/prohibitin superfamily)
MTTFIIFIILIIFLSFSIKTVEQSTVAVVELFGKFRRILPAGLQFKIPFFESIRERVSLRQQNFAVEGQYPSKDKVIVTISNNLIYTVDPSPEGVKRYVYALDDRKRDADLLYAA